MARNIIFFLLLYTTTVATTEDFRKVIVRDQKDVTAQYDWTVVGAGHAGIVATGVLLDLGINPEKICWIDPEFNVGRLGKYYSSVPSNTKTRHFIEFIKGCRSFQNCQCKAIDFLYTLDLEKEYILKVVIDPLECITKHLRKQVKSIPNMIDSLQFYNDAWNIGTQSEKITSKSVILATGSHPKTLDYDCKNVIPLDYALDIEFLKKAIKPDDIVTVVGSSHSAILLLKLLSEINVKKIINLYSRPIIYAVEMGTWTLHNAEGLKGVTAQWAKEVLEANPPKNIIRLKNTPENQKQALDECTKIIYACGYEKNQLPPLTENPTYVYDETTGLIAPRLFGIGIAFPNKYNDPHGNEQWGIGVNSFMRYAQQAIPQWMNNKNGLYYKTLDELLSITIL